MTAAVGLLALLLHAGLVGAAAPLLLGYGRWLPARLAGRAGPPVVQPWRDWRRLVRKPTPVAEASSAVTRWGPRLALLAAAAAALLVPSFTLGMATAPLADAVVIAGLLATSRAVLALVAMDSGSAVGGLHASRATTRAALAEPALLAVILLLALLAGTTNLDGVVAALREAGLHTPLALAVLAVALLAVADTGWDPAAGPADADPLVGQAGLGLGGTGLALLQITIALRRLVWLSLVAALCLPATLAPEGGGAVAWLAGAAAWVAKMGVLATGLAAVEGFGPQPGGRTTVQWLGAALVLGLLAVLLLFAGQAAA